MPAANLLSDWLHDKWRSDAATSVAFTWSLPDAKPIRMVGIFGSIYSADTTWRLRLSNTVIGAGEVFDSTEVNAGFVKVNEVADGDFCQAVMVLPAGVVDPSQVTAATRSGSRIMP